MYYPAGRDALTSVGLLFLVSGGNADQLSPGKEDEDERLGIGSAADKGITAVGVAFDTISCFCFFVLRSC